MAQGVLLHSVFPLGHFLGCCQGLVVLPVNQHRGETRQDSSAGLGGSHAFRQGRSPLGGTQGSRSAPSLDSDLIWKNPQQSADLYRVNQQDSGARWFRYIPGFTVRDTLQAKPGFLASRPRALSTASGPRVQYGVTKGHGHS